MASNKLDTYDARPNNSFLSWWPGGENLSPLFAFLWWMSNRWNRWEFHALDDFCPSKGSLVWSEVTQTTIKNKPSRRKRRREGSQGDVRTLLIFSFVLLSRQEAIQKGALEALLEWMLHDVKNDFDDVSHLLLRSHPQSPTPKSKYNTIITHPTPAHSHWTQGGIPRQYPP